jgi:predicted RNA-binding protein YlqC (UPF0109 family)
MQADQQFLEFVVKALVDNPAEVKTTRTVDEMGVLITLDVGAADMGKIIGRQGNTAKSIRTLLRVVGMKNNSRVNLKINEPVGGLRSPERMASAAAAAPAPSAYASPAPFMSPSVSSASKSVDEAMADLKLE